MAVEDLHSRRLLGGSLRHGAYQIGQALLAAPPAPGPAPQATRWLPLMLISSLAVWLVLPAQWVVTLTPPIGAAALACTGAFLSRVLLQVGRYHYHRLEGHGDQAPAASRLRGALLRAAWVLAATALLATVYLALALWLLDGPEDAGVARLLWALTVGGMILSLVVGDVFLRFVEALEHYLQR